MTTQTHKVTHAEVTPLDDNGQPSGPARVLPGVTEVTITQDVPACMHARIATVPLVTAGELLGIGRTKTYALRAAGEFPVKVLCILGEYRVRVKDIEEFLDTFT